MWSFCIAHFLRFIFHLKYFQLSRVAFVIDLLTWQEGHLDMWKCQVWIQSRQSWGCGLVEQGWRGNWGGVLFLPSQSIISA